MGENKLFLDEKTIPERNKLPEPGDVNPCYSGYETPPLSLSLSLSFYLSLSF